MAVKNQHFTHHNHWEYVYRHRRRLHGISTNAIMYSQILGVAGSLAAGLVLDIHKYSIGMLVGALLVLPGIVDLTATLGAVLSAKINHRTHPDKVGAVRFAIKSLLFSLMVGILSGLIVGTIGGLVAAVFFDAGFFKVLSVSTSALALTGLIGFPVIAVFTLAVKKFALNPDDVVGPIESSLFDVLTIIAFSASVRWLA